MRYGQKYDCIAGFNRMEELIWGRFKRENRKISGVNDGKMMHIRMGNKWFSGLTKSL